MFLSRHKSVIKIGDKKRSVNVGFWFAEVIESSDPRLPVGHTVYFEEKELFQTMEDAMRMQHVSSQGDDLDTADSNRNP